MVNKTTLDTQTQDLVLEAQEHLCRLRDSLADLVLSGKLSPDEHEVLNQHLAPAAGCVQQVLDLLDASKVSRARGSTSPCASVTATGGLTSGRLRRATSPPRSTAQPSKPATYSRHKPQLNNQDSIDQGAGSSTTRRFYGTFGHSP